MTEGYQPHRSQGSSRGSASPDQDTTTLPRLSAAPPSNAPPANVGSGSNAGQRPNAGQPEAGSNQPNAGWSNNPPRSAGTGPAWSPPTNRPEPTGYQGEEPAAGIGSRLAAAASAATATATGAASTAKGAIRTAANDAEAKATRPAKRSGRAGRQPRRARLTLSHVNVYSVFKFSCVLAIALFFVWLIMVGVLYGILDVSGVFSKINDTVHTISGDGRTNDVVTGSLVFGSAIIIGVVNIVLFIALSTIGAMIYNLCADLVGGAEVTLSERE
ncbi:MAG: DUF3566 domain-containing protein [Jatrophihabitantaceae bacterium]